MRKKSQENEQEVLNLFFLPALLLPYSHLLCVSVPNFLSSLASGEGVDGEGGEDEGKGYGTRGIEGFLEHQNT